MGNNNFNSFDPVNPRIMTHLVAGYPDDSRAMAAAKALLDSGTAFLEIQFPFSDPSADGPVIQTACSQALARGFKLDKGFLFLKDLRKINESTPIFLMTYGSLAYNRGMETFCKTAKDAGVSGLIIPDLQPGGDAGLYSAAAKIGITVIPVIAPSISDSRLESFKNLKLDYIYTALRTGITGKETELGKENYKYIEKVRKLGAKVLAGFGIRRYSQIKALAGCVHAAIVGSHITSALAGLADKNEETVYSEIQRVYLELAGKG